MNGYKITKGKNRRNVEELNISAAGGPMAEIKEIQNSEDRRQKKKKKIRNHEIHERLGAAFGRNQNDWLSSNKIV